MKKNKKAIIFWICISLWSPFTIFLAVTNVNRIIKLKSEIISIGSTLPDKQTGKIYPIAINVKGYLRTFYVDKNYSMRRKKVIYEVTVRHILYMILNLMIYCALIDKLYPIGPFGKSKKFDIIEYLGRPLSPKI